MALVTHVKYKNTGIVFQALVKEMISAILKEHNSTNRNSSSSILKKYFTSKTEIGKELLLYKTLTDLVGLKNEKHNITKILDLVLEKHSKLDFKKLNKEKYSLLGEIKSKIPNNDLFNIRIQEYRLLASIYKLFNTPKDNIKEHVMAYDTVVSNLGEIPTIATIQKPIKEWSSQPKDIQKLALQLLIEKFNTKYNKLSDKQRNLISKYLHEEISSTGFRDFIYTECLKINKKLKLISDNSKDTILKIKIDEISNLLEIITKSRYISEDHLDSLMLYYEFIDLMSIGK
jgi:mRNA-degrading endonuclease RelE of RelBE toxin-antitoxin system